MIEILFHRFTHYVVEHCRNRVCWTDSYALFRSTHMSLTFCNSGKGIDAQNLDSGFQYTIIIVKMPRSIWQSQLPPRFVVCCILRPIIITRTFGVTNIQEIARKLRRCTSTKPAHLFTIQNTLQNKKKRISYITLHYILRYPE